MIPIQWPEDKQFAFTIFDDTDLQTVENTSEVYRFLAELGLRTTKTVWPIKGAGTPKFGGSTCEDDAYLKWVLSLKELGFEIALHNATFHTSTRAETIRGIETFRRLFDHYPYSFANHEGCDESIYWGRYRLSGMHRWIYDRFHPRGNQQAFLGHVEDHPLFWGDICKTAIKYVRNFVFGDINTLKACPLMPYHDEERPFVNYWFAATEGARVDSFNAAMKEKNQDRLATEGGACIIYTHLACGFFEEGRLNRRFQFLMERISKMNGWFVPAQTLLDHILTVRGHRVINARERSRLERTWLTHKFFRTRGTS